MTDYIKNPHAAMFTDPIGCGKSHLILDLIMKKYNKFLTTSSLSSQCLDGMRHIMSMVRSVMMTMFDLFNQ